MSTYLQRIGEIERRVDALVDSVNRVPKVTAPKAQLLRLFFTHKFVPLSAIEPDANGEKERPYFLLRIDGIVFSLGDAQSKLCSLRAYLDAVTVTIFADRRQTVLYNYEWSTSTFPAGLSADSMVFKIAAEKSCTCRVEVRFSDNILPKYTLSPTMKDILQAKTNELSKQEICEAFLYQVAQRRLFLEKDSRTFKIDEALAPLFGEELYCKTSDVWTKLLSSAHIAVIERLELDLSLSSTNHQTALMNNLFSFLSKTGASFNDVGTCTTNNLNSTSNANISNLASTGMNPICSNFGDSIVDVTNSGGLTHTSNTAGLSSSSSVRDVLRAIGGRVIDIEVFCRASSPSSSTFLLRHSSVVQSVAERRVAVQQALRLQQQTLSFCAKELREDVFLCQQLKQQLQKYEEQQVEANTESNSSDGRNRKRTFDEFAKDFPKPPIATEYEIISFHFIIILFSYFDN